MSLEKVGLRIPGGEFGRDVCHSKCAPAGMVPEDPGGKARGLPGSRIWEDQCFSAHITGAVGSPLTARHCVDMHLYTSVQVMRDRR